jgi:hypothetical protein
MTCQTTHAMPPTWTASGCNNFNIDQVNTCHCCSGSQVWCGTGCQDKC